MRKKLSPVIICTMIICAMLAISATANADTAIKYTFIAKGYAKSTANVIKWNASENADTYEVYYAKCGKSLKKIKTTSALKFTKRGIGKSQICKYKIKAYKKANGKKQYIEATPIVYVAGAKAKYSNAVKVVIKSSDITISPNEEAKITARITKKSSRKPVLRKGNSTAGIRYISSDSAVASVDGKGKIKAISVGTAYIYAYAANGVSDRIAVTVKKNSEDYVMLGYDSDTDKNELQEKIKAGFSLSDLSAITSIEFYRTGSLPYSVSELGTGINLGDYEDGDTRQRNIRGYMLENSKLVIVGDYIYGNANCEMLFYGFTNVTEINLKDFDTSKVTDMNRMFRGCYHLTSLDLRNFNTSHATNMENMFHNCPCLTSLDLSNFNTSKVTDMSYMFSMCYGLDSLDLSSFDTSNVTDMGCMFRGCSGLTTLDVSGFNTSNVTDMDGMFAGSGNAQSDFADSSIAYASYNETSSDSEVIPMELRSISFGNQWDTSKVTDMNGMFNYCTKLESLDLSRFDTANVTDMSYMFAGCKAVESLDVSGFNTSKVKDMRFMFNDCEMITSLDLSNFDTSNATNMRDMFCWCSGLTSLDLSSFDTSRVKNMVEMFYCCFSLKTLDLSSFDTSGITSMGFMFTDCSELTALDLTSFDTSNVLVMNQLFRNCTSLTTLDLSSFDTSKVTQSEYMFNNCGHGINEIYPEATTVRINTVYESFWNRSRLGTDTLRWSHVSGNDTYTHN